MILGEDTSILLQPLSPPVPFGLILSRWLKAKFHPRKCREELEKIVERKCILQDFFRPSEIEQGGLVATDELLFNFFAKDRKWICWFSNQYKGKSFKAEFTSEEVATVASLIRSAAQTTDVDAFKFDWSSVVSDELLQVLCSAYSSTTRYGQWPRVDAPGIYRREHASLVIRSQTTTIVVDPQCLNFGWTTNNSKFPAEQGLGVVDAIMVTHSHNDHWHLPSILRHVADATTPVIVPHVPRVNLLTEEDFSASLELTGQKTYAPQWYSTLKIGDIEIDILPFYGEQPTRHPPGPDATLRNWGNCYRFNCPEFSVLILVDSGTDPAGSVFDMVQRSVEQRGPVDVVLSCCLSFAEAINFGLPSYFLTLPFRQLQAIFQERERGKRHFVTSGCEDVAEVCGLVNARFFLPYAHGFRGLGRDPMAGKSITDAQAATRVADNLKTRSLKTRVVTWNPGDVALFEDGKMFVQPFPVRA